MITNSFFHLKCLTAISIFIFAFINLSEALECYVCTNQPDNKGKCVGTVRTCGGDEEKCLTEVRWGSTPYWAPSGEKQYYISKRCSSTRNCEESIQNLTRRCDRIWYNDWECVECCFGDRCNYFVTLTSAFNPPNAFIIVLCIVFTLFCR